MEEILKEMSELLSEFLEAGEITPLQLAYCMGIRVAIIQDIVNCTWDVNDKELSEFIDGWEKLQETMEDADNVAEIKQRIVS